MVARSPLNENDNLKDEFDLCSTVLREGIKLDRNLMHLLLHFILWGGLTPIIAQPRIPVKRSKLNTILYGELTSKTFQ